MCSHAGEQARRAPPAAPRPCDRVPVFSLLRLRLWQRRRPHEPLLQQVCPRAAR